MLIPQVLIQGLQCQKWGPYLYTQPTVSHKQPHIYRNKDTRKVDKVKESETIARVQKEGVHTFLEAHFPGALHDYMPDIHSSLEIDVKDYNSFVCRNSYHHWKLAGVSLVTEITFRCLSLTRWPTIYVCTGGCHCIFALGWIFQ